MNHILETSNLTNNVFRDENTLENTLEETTISKRKTARLAGLFFLLMVAFGLFAEIFFRQKIFVDADVAETASNILSNVFLYRVGIASDLFMSLCYLITALVLYKLLSSVNKNIATVMVVFATAGSIILMVNVLNGFAPLVILNGNNSLAAFNTGELQAMAMLFYQLSEHGYMIGQIFFALWVLPLGILIYQSRFIPKVFGIMFMTEALFGMISVVVHFLFPNEMIETFLVLPGTFAELTFMLWLLIRGVKAPK